MNNIIYTTFLKLDFLGFKYHLQENNNKSNYSFVGVVFSLILGITCVVLAFMFGTEIYQRKSPVVDISEEFQDNSEIFFKKCL